MVGYDTSVAVAKSLYLESTAYIFLVFVSIYVVHTESIQKKAWVQAHKRGLSFDFCQAFM